ncbi:MAG: hypothetical protein JNJ89_00315 [Rubrivivax sp.]|nr:hypothetical protein [Rubrivivax sp.]
MDPLAQALHAAARAAVPLGPRDILPAQPALLVGAGGRLGSALLSECLVAGRFASVAALVAAPLTSAVRGLHALAMDRWAAPGPLGATVALVVFERERFSNGRDDAFVMPQPAELPALARRLHAGGVRRLMVVLPHAGSMLPGALTAGFGSHAEAAVAAMGFEQLVLVKPSQHASPAPAAGWLQRLARWWLSQLRWMVPEREQPLRSEVLARLTVQVARQLPLAAPGTHVLPQAVLWQATQDPDGGSLRLARWLARARQGLDDAAPGVAVATGDAQGEESAPR